MDDAAQPLLQALAAGGLERRGHGLFPFPLPLHLPAHGRGRGLAPGLRQLLRRPPGSWDLPELPAIGGPLEAEGAVAESQRRCAALLAADHCWFGVHGASGLLQAALLALVPPGGRVLLPRNLHRSLLHGCVLAGLEPVLFTPPFDPTSGLWLPAEAAQLQAVLAAAPPLQAAVVVDPTYHGRRAMLPPLVALLHAAGLPVLVDQAHGRGEALAAGADLVVLSLQKAAGGLAQSAALLAQGSRVCVERIERALLWLGTSSPSALLLASSASALAAAHSHHGQRRRAAAEARGLRLQRHLIRQGLPLLPATDPLRLVLLTAPLGIRGLEADAWLLERRVVAELPEPGALTFVLGEHPPPGLRWRLGSALLALRTALGAAPLPPFSPPPLPLVATPELPLAEAWRAPREAVPLAGAVGRVAAEPLCPYPPGIPLLVPGERIDADRAAWLREQQRLWPGQIADTVKVVAGA